jgi:hypothetical protein
VKNRMLQSSISWIDFSEQDRRRMADVVQLFRERDTRDELGLGTVRDAFANLFFPGITTIQTRAKYMLLVPWIYQRRERLKTPSKHIARRARWDELNLIGILLDTGDTEGVIGKDARNKLQRLPSSIYWSGLGTWGIRLFNGSQAQYHRSLDAFYRYQREQRQQVKQEDERTAIRIAENWDPGLPQPKEFPHRASLSLIKKEADYLHDRIMTNCSQSLLAFLVNQTSPTEAVDFVWEHPAFTRFPQRLRDQVEHAHNFSEAMQGAVLLYNLMLGEKSGREEDVVKHRKRLDRLWSETIRTRRAVLSQWDLTRFWEIVASEGARVPWRTHRFVECWIELVLERNGDVMDLITDPGARNLIYDREVALKRSRARLQSQRALELWGGDAGTAQLSFRWGVASTIINDILRGMQNDA